MQSDAAVHIVVTDANILINLIHVGRLGLLEVFPNFTFTVPEHVVEEVNRPDQAQQLQELLARQIVRQEVISEVHELALYAELRRIMGRGESACLSIAASRGWMVASDERRRFRREALARLGEGRLITTAGLFIVAIRAGLMSINEADEAKAVLENHRFRMAFDSFRAFFEDC